MTEREMSSIQTSNHELEVMTRDLDQLHHDLMPGHRAALADLVESIRGELGGIARVAHAAASRRNFLKGGLVTAGALGGGMVVAACGSSSSDTGSAAATGSGSSSAANQDGQIVMLAASLEVLAINTYTTAAGAAAKGSFGAVPPAIPTFITTTVKHHTDHLNAWNGVLTQLGQPKVTDPNKKFNAIVQQQLPNLKTLADVAGLASTLELVAAETYTNGSALVVSPAGRQTALSIAPIEYQHYTILQLILGHGVDANAAFAKTDMAAGLDSLNG